MPTSVKSSSAEPAVASPAASQAPAAGPSRDPKKLIALGAGLVAVILGAVVVFGGSGRKEEFAQRQLGNARASAEMGDLPTAASGFQTIIETYGGTRAAAEATIGLNQVRLINGQNELAVTGIREFIASKPDREFVPPAFGLLGAALENAAKPADAAQAYRSAAEAADVDYLRASYLVEAGRALATAGRRDEAAQTYRDVIARYPETPMTTEAKVRLAELTAGRM
jgi:TolA-binding protein